MPGTCQGSATTPRSAHASWRPYRAAARSRRASCWALSLSQGTSQGTRLSQGTSQGTRLSRGMSPGSPGSWTTERSSPPSNERKRKRMPPTDRPSPPTPTPAASPPSPPEEAPINADEDPSAGSSTASGRVSPAASHFISDAGPVFDPEAAPPGPEPEPQAELHALPTVEPGWEEEVVQQLLDAQGQLLHGAIGVAEQDWLHTSADLKAIGGPRTRSLNPGPAAAAAAAGGGPR